MMTMPETRAETFACGDFNSFPDARGAAEISEITRLSTYYEEAAPYGCPIDTISGCQVSGTQIAYPYDTYVKYKGSFFKNESEIS